MSTLVILVGSLRDGLNAALGRTAALVAARQGWETREYARLADLPHYHEGLDAQGVDAVVDEFRQVVRDADAVLFITPEYNGGPSSVIKNALDTASRPHGTSPLSGKATAVIGATMSKGATVSAREALTLGLMRAGARVVGDGFGIPTAHQKLTDAGYPDDVTQAVDGVLAELLESVAADLVPAGH